MIESTGIIVVSLFLFPLLWLLYAKSQKQEGSPGMLRKQHVEHITWDGSYTVAFQHALDVFGLMNAEVVQADPNIGAITARLGKSPLSSSIQLEMRTMEGVTIITVRILAALPFDFGYSSKLAKVFLAEWESHVVSFAESTEEVS